MNLGYSREDMNVKLKTIKSCGKCRDWNDCNGHEYYKISDIRQYCRYQVMWIIEHFLIYAEGHLICERLTWPEEFEATGYTDAENTGGAVKASAPYEAILQIVAPVSERLGKTGKDGKILWAQCQMQKTYQELDQDARNALNYTVGVWPKRLGFVKWLEQRNRRGKMKGKSLQKAGGLDKSNSTLHN